MATYRVEFEGWVSSVDDTTGEKRLAPADEIEELLDGMMDILLEDPKVADPTYSGTLARGEVEISITVEAEYPVEAHVFGNAVLRSAAHGVGVGTPEWELDWCSISLVRADQTKAEPALAS